MIPPIQPRPPLHETGAAILRLEKRCLDQRLFFCLPRSEKQTHVFKGSSSEVSYAFLTGMLLKADFGPTLQWSFAGETPQNQVV